VKISDNAPFSLQMFVFVHIPLVFSVLLTYSLKINSLLFDPSYINLVLTLTLTLDLGRVCVCVCVCVGWRSDGGRLNRGRARHPSRRFHAHHSLRLQAKVSCHLVTSLTIDYRLAHLFMHPTQRLVGLLVTSISRPSIFYLSAFYTYILFELQLLNKRIYDDDDDDVSKTTRDLRSF